MDMSGDFNAGNPSRGAEKAALLADAADRSEGSPLKAVAWRNGRAIHVDLAQNPAQPVRRILPEHLAIAALYAGAYAMGFAQLKF